MKKINYKLIRKNEIKNNQEKGGVLIILTIIVAILILAKLTISMFLKENKTVKNASLEDKTEETSVVLKNEKTIAEQYGIEQTENKTIIDENNEPIITIPAGYILVDPNKNKDIIYKDNSNPKIEEGIVITDKVNKDGKSIGNEFVWVPVSDLNKIYDSTNNRGKLYKFKEFNVENFTTKDFPKLIEYSPTGNREPDLLSRYDNDNEVYLSDIKLTAKEFEKELKDEFEKTMSSINIYKGFYIGRYETGGFKQGTITKAVVQKGRKDINYTNWYYMYASSKNIKKEGSNVTSSMIWGCEWDAVMNWFLSCEGETAEYVTNSEKKGYFNQSNSCLTGYYAVNNIYDMAGNVSEWTIEADEIAYRAYHGGNYYNPGSIQPASYRSFANPNINNMEIFGSRATLYIKNNF